MLTIQNTHNTAVIYADRVVIPKEIRRTMRIREGDPSLMTLEETKVLRWMKAMMETGKRCGGT